VPAARWIPVACLLVMGMEYANASIPYAPAPPRQTAAGGWLARTPEPGAVLYLPLDVDAGNTPYMIESLEHRRPIVNGYSGQRPGFFPALVDTMSSFPDAESLWTLHELDVRFVVSAAPLAIEGWPLVERARLRQAEPAGTRYIFEVRWTPEVEARLETVAAPPPPDPGPARFAPGEVARYDVRWLGAGSSVAAGQAAITVAAPPAMPGAAYRFIATAETAPWVSRFFEARDVFETIATPTLLPLVHARRLREGRRTLDRVARFDHARRTVAISTDDGSEPLELRIAPGARDALTAFYYARATALEPGRELRLPINEVGRGLTLALRAVGLEEIDYGGRRTSALRVEPAVIQRVARRQAATIVAWLSTDARRIPLLVDVSGAFGRVRAELRSYTR